MTMSLVAPACACPADLPAPELTATARWILEDRYLLRDEQGQVIETPKECFWRTAWTVAQADRPSPYKCVDHDGIVLDVARKFYGLMCDLRFMPNTPTLMNAGKPEMCLSACFVLPVPDSIQGIFGAAGHQAVVQKAGGGTGFSFSRLRPAGDRVGSTAGVSSGVISFMEAFNTTTEVIKQGSTRRGANMGMLRVDHPQIREFIGCKDDRAKFQNFNLSVALTDTFMAAVQAKTKYDLINPRNGKVVGQEDACEIMRLIAEHAWGSGEPGIVFIDEINRKNFVPDQEIEATNPCGEQPLAPYESCNLGSINLVAHLTITEDEPARINWNALERTIHLAVRFLDNVITVNEYPIPEIEAATKANRKIGLGLMGWADALSLMAIPYDSDEAIELADTVMSYITSEAVRASMALAEERGVFPNWERSVWGTFPQPMRNASLTTIAPTGTISMIAGTSGGIEPHYGLVFKRNQAERQFVEINPHFEAVAKDQGFYSIELMERIRETGSCHGFVDVPPRVQDHFPTTYDIAPDWHIRMQAAFQEHTHAAISKTVNLPETATVDDVLAIYLQAYHLKCKGVTVYRNNSRADQVFSVGKTEASVEVGDIAALAGQELTVLETRYEPPSRPRPLILDGKTFQWYVGDHKVFITVNSDDVGVREVFIESGKVGSDMFSMCQALGILISGMLKEGMGTELIKQKLKGIKAEPTANPGGFILSIPDAIAKSIEMVELGAAQLHELKTKSIVQIERVVPRTSNPCPKCESPMQPVEGCMTCTSCGFSKCS